MDIIRFKVPKKNIDPKSINTRFIGVKDSQLWESLEALLNLGIISYDKRNRVYYVPGNYTIGLVEKYPLIYIWSKLVDIVEWESSI